MTRYCILFNPVAGRRCNQRRLADLQSRLGPGAELRPTPGPHCAGALVRQAALEGFDVVVAAGGDGTVHEAASGLLDADRPDTTLLVFPVGSANDFAHSLVREYGDTVRWPNLGTKVDVGRVTELNAQGAWFINCCGLGFSAMVTIESRKIRRLRGTLLYGLATLRAMRRHFTVQDWRVAIDDEPLRPEPTLMLSVMNGRREGNFILAPDARLDDGQFDYLVAGRVSRWDVVRLLPALATSGPPADFPNTKTGRCRRLVVESTTPITCHVDGEVLARPADDRQRAVIELVPRRLQVAVIEP